MTGGDLPSDLLGAIYNKCSTSYDRRRFGAVCKSWRSASSREAKLPALPLLLPSTGNSYLDKYARAYSPEAGRVLRPRLPWLPNGKQVVGSHDGGWVAAATGSQIEIVNLFTRGCCKVPVKGHIAGETSVEKVVFSEDPTSEGCIVAAMTYERKSCMMLIALYRPGCPGAGWTARGCDADFIDIAFCGGELYGLSCKCNDDDYDGSHEHRLYRLGIGVNEDDASAVTISFDELNIQCSEMFKPNYIFELRGKIAAASVMKVRLVGGGGKARIIKVFELVASSDTTQAYKYAWAEVTTLGDHALFLGPGCCKAVNLSTGRGEVQRNHIYYSMLNYKLHDDPECMAPLDLGSLDVYCCENQAAYRLERIISRGYCYKDNRHGTIGTNRCTWIWPPQSY